MFVLGYWKQVPCSIRSLRPYIEYRDLSDTICRNLLTSFYLRAVHRDLTMEL